jgi:hypothetical protein
MAKAKAKDKVLKLAKDLEFTSNTQLYDYMFEAYINGRFEQIKRFWKRLPKDNKHELVEHIRVNHGNDESHNYFVGLF